MSETHSNAAPSGYALERLRTKDMKTYSLITQAAETMASIAESYVGMGGVTDLDSKALGDRIRYGIVMTESSDQSIHSIKAASHAALLILALGFQKEEEKATDLLIQTGKFRRIGFGSNPTEIQVRALQRKRQEDEESNQGSLFRSHSETGIG